MGMVKKGYSQVVFTTQQSQTCQTETVAGVNLETCAFEWSQLTFSYRGTGFNQIKQNGENQVIGGHAFCTAFKARQIPSDIGEQSSGHFKREI